MAMALLSGSLMLTSCGDDFLTPQPTESDAAGGAATESTILNDLASAYQILTMDSYGNANYNSIVLMADLQSDDIYKGGGNAGDQQQLYKLSNYEATPADNLGGLWKIMFTGIARCNNTLLAVDNATGVDEALLKRLKGEALTLRAYYSSVLWRTWGNVPLYDGLLESPYMTKQLTADEAYKKIKDDLDAVIDGSMLPMATRGDLTARVNMATAKMLRARVVLYQKDASCYGQITKDMADIISSGEYQLVSKYADIFTSENEFNSEDIFESNQYPEGRDWAAAWTGYGTNLPAFISPSDFSITGAVYGEPKGGWGFGPVRLETWNMYESGDTRREASINDFRGTVNADGSGRTGMFKGKPFKYGLRFQDTGLFQAKYCARTGYNEAKTGATDLNYCNNLRIFRYAETLLNYAELVKILGQSEVAGISAQDCLDKVRDRAFGDTSHRVAATAENIKQERRLEFVGEGMRYYDLVRWGDAPRVLTENDAAMQVHRTWTENKKFIPIPESEMNRTKGTAYELKQNPY